MIFKELELSGSFIIEPEKLEDERGFFARSWDQKQFEEHGLNSEIIQCNISFNRKKGTIRGMHYQISPYEEVKVVRCTLGAIFDVIIDLRPNSKTFQKWHTVELNSENRKMLYIPEGFAHGFQTLQDNSEVFYQMSQVYSPNHSSGIRYDDSRFKIQWPIHEKIISEKDLSW